MLPSTLVATRFAGETPATIVRHAAPVGRALPDSMPETLVIIPAFNEEQALPAVLRELRDSVPDWHVLVVDDGSSDATAEVARRGGARVARLPFNMGVGAALRTGFRYAERTGMDRCVQVDADGQHGIGDIVRLVGELDASDAPDMVVGSRFAGSDRDDRFQVGRVRGLAMRILRGAVTILTGVTFTDTSSGFRAFGRRSIVLFARKYPRDYLSDTVEALILASYDGLVVREVPVVMNERQAGVPSAQGPRLAYHYVRVLMSLAITISLRGRRAQRARKGVAT